MSTTNQFQALDYLEHTRNLAKKDWVLKLIKLFPNGGVVNNLRVVELERINTLDTEKQKDCIVEMINKMESEQKLITVKVQPNQSNPSGNSEVDLKTAADKNSKPITLMF